MRVENWPQVLLAEIEKAESKPFSWGGRNGGHDCCLFAADVVKALTGTDYAAPFRGRYTTERGAKRALTIYGAGTIPATLEKILGPAQPPLMARRGDVVVANTPLGPAAGICLGTVAAFAGPSGLSRLPLSACTACWRID